jgi:hypothetical protein
MPVSVDQLTLTLAVRSKPPRKALSLPDKGSHAVRAPFANLQWGS